MRVLKIGFRIMARANLIDVAKSLMSLARSGWMLRGVSGVVAETVAEHCFLSAYICLDVGSRIEGIDIGRLTLYALIHDIGETFVGDIVKAVSSLVGEVKEEIEFSFVDKHIDNPIVKRLFRGYLEQKDTESRLARLCNYIATYIMGLEYKRLGYRVDDIVDNTYREIRDMAKKLGVENIVDETLNSYRG